jgi:hypothetical protein
MTGDVNICVSTAQRNKQRAFHLVPDLNLSTTMSPKDIKPSPL